MQIKQYEIWLANLNPRSGTEAGKIRPVVIVQTDLLNNLHPSTIICPVTSNVIEGAEPLRIHLNRKQLDKPSDVLIDQARSIDNKRLIKKVGRLNDEQQEALKESLRIVLDL